MIRTLSAILTVTAAPAFAHDEAHFHLHEINGWKIAGAVALVIAVSIGLKALRQ